MPPESSISADNAYFDSTSFGRVGYLDEGESDRALVLLHGWNSHSGTWKKIIPGLIDRFRIIAPSFPPHFGDFRDIPVKRYASMAGELLGHLRIVRAAFVGNSMGGLIALNVLCSSPGMVTALVLEDTAGFWHGGNAAAVRSDPLVSCLNNSGVRTLIMWGASDRIIPPEAGRTLHEAVRNSVYLEFAGTGHVPHWERPAGFVSALTEFMR